MLKWMVMPARRVSAAVGPRSLAGATLGETESGRATRLLSLTEAVMRFATAAEAAGAPAAIPIDVAASKLKRRRSRRVQRIDKIL
jgi:hypothetical protein